MSTALPPDSQPTREERNWAMAAHLSGLFLSVIGPLLIWLIKKDESAFVSEESREALNFQLMLFIVFSVAGVVVTLLALITCGFGGLLFIPIAAAICVVDVIFCIMGAIAASNGKHYRYPFNLRLVK